MCLALAAAGERDEVDLGDFGIGHPVLLGLVVGGVGVLDRLLHVLVDAGDRLDNAGVHVGGDREP